MSDETKLRDDDMIGGDTPFVSPSALPFHRAAMDKDLGYKHRPMRFGIESAPNDDNTRYIKLIICALAHADYDYRDRAAISGLSREDFMRGFVGGANTDLMVMGISPLISLTEVAKMAENPEIIRATRQEPR